LIAAMILATFAGLWAWPWNAPAPGIDPAAEATATAILRETLAGRAGPDHPAFNSIVNEADPWTTGEAVRARALDPGADDADLVAALDVIEKLALRKGEGESFAGYPYALGADTVALVEATADVGCAQALVLSVRPGDAALRARARTTWAWLLEAQNPGGSWSTIPDSGPAGASTGATVFALQAVATLAVVLGEENTSAGAVTRAAIFLASTFDPEGGFFNINPARREGRDRHVHGVSERAALSLLEAREVLKAAGASLPPSADEALLTYRRAFVPLPLAPWATASPRPEDTRYGHLLPERARSSFASYSWAPFAWRLLVSSAFAAEEGPERSRWRGEATRLRQELPAMASEAGAIDTWHLAEVLFAAELVQAAQGAPLTTRRVAER
jgi:hypothetical protein